MEPAEFIDVEVIGGADKLERTLNHLSRAAAHCSVPDGAVLEFGVYSGATISHLAKLFPDRTLHGFDSFEGLPEEWVTSDVQVGPKLRVVPKGHFKRDGLPDVPENVTLIKGWFDETIAPWKSEIERISLLHVDCDLYSSTKTIFEELDAKIVAGTVIVFDEFFPFGQLQWYRAWREGEHKALVEWLRDRGRAVEPLCRTDHEQIAFKVTR